MTRLCIVTVIRQWGPILILTLTLTLTLRNTSGIASYMYCHYLHTLNTGYSLTIYV